MIRASTVIGLAVMDAFEAGRPVMVSLHDMPPDEQNRLLTRLVELGGEPWDGHESVLFGGSLVRRVDTHRERAS